MRSSIQLASSAILLAIINGVTAGFDVNSNTNIAIYWGQNSYGQGTGDLAQQRLSYYCANMDVDIIPIAFATRIVGTGGQPEINLANAGNNCTTFDGTALLNCPEVAADIATCQNNYDKTILLSVGGATYTEGGFASSDAAVAAANTIWATFGPKQPGSNALRPFGNSSVDGFDFDFEAGTSNMAPFASQLRFLMDAASSASYTKNRYILTAAPQCPYPDFADNDMLNGTVFFDAIFVQFYNNYCGVQSYVAGASDQWNFNFGTWESWAKNTSKNSNVKVFLGVPANTGAAGSGYMSASALRSVITYSSQFSSFGGTMMWDATQAWANPGFINNVKGELHAVSNS
ncbi:glycoside hydrolase family 18 protein [Lepidopterella palustris CBS 459.81]|uniref:chitinase n=1 Tax=Lepidopterella palustris CBS 459.81 TaxID=1314670 RepID=A0A8E2EH34_9PEZI|nr:glycoside hydrolase family 18 protein [Lepidopterella palustris CBS 459.81]